MVRVAASAESVLTRQANPSPERRRISIAIMALGGQGGGILTDWIAQLGELAGYRTQSTSVPGVAQRTGATTYYIEMFPSAAGDAEPVLALAPAPGDVDIVIASELVEAGRAILRGFVTRDLTTLIGSDHRVYAISEKTAKGSGIVGSERILEAAARSARRFIHFDMSRAAQEAGSHISAVMLGALAGSAALPFPDMLFQEVIRTNGKAVEANLRGFEAGAEGARSPKTVTQTPGAALPEPTTSDGRRLRQWVLESLPASAHRFALEGVRRLMDYQDCAYARLYLDRLAHIRASDDGRDDWALTSEAARYLALWMSYEDTIRVADLKIRGTRFERVWKEVGVADSQVAGITEFMHPRYREFCDTLPAWLGRRLLHSGLAARLLSGLFSSGRFVETSSIRGFMTLSLVASLRPLRRFTLRYSEEQARIGQWLDMARLAAVSAPDAAVEIVRCQRLIKGYGDTYDRGIANFDALLMAYKEMKDDPRAAGRLRVMREGMLSSPED